MRHVVFILCVCLFAPLFSFASEPNAGFVQGLWYSSEPIFEGVPTRIYIAVRNNTEHDLTGTVRFTDNGKRIGSSPINALSGRLVEAWIDWTPSYGEHTIAATVSDATLHIIGGDTESIDITGVTETDTLTVDYDTDGDGIGNTIDADDDNDGISDIVEKERGSNPLVQNPKTVTTASREDRDTTEDNVAVVTRPSETMHEEGLEQYLDDGVMSTLLSNATQRIENAKTSLDEYRESRNNESTDTQIILTTPQVTPLGTYTDTATITRSKIEPQNNLLRSFVASIASLFSFAWSLVLWLISRALGAPAILELILLIGIVYMIYRTARRLGRRPQ